MNFVEEGEEEGYCNNKEQEQQQRQEEEEESLPPQEEEDGEVTTTTTTSKHLFSSPRSSSSSSPSKFKNFIPQYGHHHKNHLGCLGSPLESSKGHEPSLNLNNKLDLMEFSLGNNSNNNNIIIDTDYACGVPCSSSTGAIEKEHMFDKVVTPSDVGKLNRLVIPKQHAEKYFPLDSSSNEKGLLLNFEDRTGKSWRFRYSYWNSSQSYVMTKGWSRFVKEKKLDAGDVVSFQRGVGESGRHRLYIDWRRRPNAPDPASFAHLELQNQMQFSQSVRWGKLYSIPQTLSSMPLPRQYEQQQQQPQLPNFNRNVQNYQHHPSQHHNYYHQQATNYGNVAAAAPQYYLRPPGGIQIGGVHQQGGDYHHHQHHHHHHNQHHLPMVIDSLPIVHGKTVGKRLRLFGVNMECPIQDESSSTPHLASSSLPPSQLRVPSSSSATVDAEYAKKGKSTSLSFDLDL